MAQAQRANPPSACAFLSLIANSRQPYKKGSEQARRSSAHASTEEKADHG
jgi:hypothetical protein